MVDGGPVPNDNLLPGDRFRSGPVVTQTELDDASQKVDKETDGESLGTLPSRYDWTRLDAYAKVLQSHDENRQLEEKRASQMKIRRDLDKQVQDLRARKESEKRDEIEYLHNMNTGIDQWKEYDAQAATKRRQQAETERAERDEQLRFEGMRRRQADEKRRADDQHLLHQIEEEVKQEQQELLAKRTKERAIFQSVLKENELNRQRKLEMKKHQAIEELSQMDEFREILEQQEQQREQEFQKRLERQKLLMKKMEETVSLRVNQKTNDDNVRALKQQAENDARAIEIENFKQRRYAEMKAEMARTVQEQIEEKRSRKMEDDELRNMHAHILKLDTIEFDKSEAQRKEITKRLYRKYRQQLLEQISHNAHREKAHEEYMNAEEIKLNRDLIEVVEKTLRDEDKQSTSHLA